ncbi:MAG: hypothetical protein ACRDRT_10430, partial [Pseudonocardiaceae bacterium]
GGNSTKASTNVRPPKPGIPQQSSDVTGIYRTSHQATLQLRRNGNLSLIVPVSSVRASSGNYTLSAGTFELTTNQCGDKVGRYTVEVRGQQVAGEAILAFTALDDTCADRRRYLTIDPWYYADS